MRHGRRRSEPARSRPTNVTPRTLVLGIGNYDRGDDAIGLTIARRVRDLGLNGVHVGELSGDPLALLERWDRADTAILIDAMSSGSAPGTVMRFDALATVLPAVFDSRVSSHGIGIGEVVALARALERLPARLIVYGVEAADFDPGSSLSPRLARTIDLTVQRIAQEVSRKG